MIFKLKFIFNIFSYIAFLRRSAHLASYKDIDKSSAFSKLKNPLGFKSDIFHANVNRNEIIKALELRKLVHADGIDLDLLEFERVFFGYYSEAIGEIWSKASIDDQNYFISQSSKFLV